MYDYASQISYRFDLAETPSFERLQCLFHDLYIQHRANPQYIFMAMPDHDVLRQYILECTNIRCPPEDVPRMLSGIVYRVLNETTGNLVRVVPLPGLEPGSVILGFLS